MGIQAPTCCGMGFVTDSNTTAIRWEARFDDDPQSLGLQSLAIGDVDFPCFSLLLCMDFRAVSLRIRSFSTASRAKIGHLCFGVDPIHGDLKMLQVFVAFSWDRFDKLPMCFLSTSDTTGGPWGPDCAIQATDVCPFVVIIQLLE